MERVIDRLHSTTPEAPSFAPSFTSRAFVLERPAGNILLYSSGRIEDDAEEPRALGGIVRQYLNHSHQAQASCDWVAATFGAPLWCHGADEAEAAESCNVAATFDDRSLHFADFEAIPAPGHTPGSTCFLWRTEQHRYLFTGDTIYIRDGAWVAAVLDGISDREQYLKSLPLVASLDFDVIVPNLTRGESIQTVSAAEKKDRVAHIIESLQQDAVG